VVINELEVRTVAHPHLLRLCQNSGGTTYLATLLDGDELYLDQIESDSAVGNANWIGRTIPPHSASSGKTLLAHLPESELAAYLERDLIASTRFTVTDPTKLREQLAQIRERGYAVAMNEHLMGFGSVAAPIFDRSGNNIAVIVVGGPTSQFSIERFHEMAPMVMASASAIGIELGYKPERG
jgi:DNA-binding IclR family transcriptional regulator